MVSSLFNSGRRYTSSISQSLIVYIIGGKSVGYFGFGGKVTEIVGSFHQGPICGIWHTVMNIPESIYLMVCYKYLIPLISPDQIHELNI